jgi:hypothetical protein
MSYTWEGTTVRYTSMHFAEIHFLLDFSMHRKAVNVVPTHYYSPKE